MIEHSLVAFIAPSYSQFLVPGFVDAHIHAPQYLYTGTGYDLELLKWLERYTYPSEARYEDVAFAEEAYSKAVVRSGEVRVRLVW